MSALRYGKGLGQAARLKRELVGIDPGHRKLSKGFFREIIQHEQHSLAIFRNNCERASADWLLPLPFRLRIRAAFLPGIYVIDQRKPPGIRRPKHIRE